MRKYTKRLKKNRFNRTFKRGGQPINKSQETNIGEETNVGKEREGVIDYLGDKIKSGLTTVASDVTDTGLKVVGLERINKAEQDNSEENNINNKINEFSDAASGVVSNITENIKNVANKTSAAIIENVNEVLGSDTVKENVQQAAENTAKLLKQNAEIFNEAINNPEVKGELIEAINNAADIGTVAVQAAKKPFNEAVEVAAEALPKAASSSLSGLIKVGTDAAAAVPGFGAIIDFGKMLNDGSKAVSGVVEATTDTIEAGSDLITETKENFEKGMKILEQNKKMAQQISNRTTQSINDFENPLNKFTSSKQVAGGRKTKHRLTKRKVKTKRVRFAF